MRMAFLFARVVLAEAFARRPILGIRLRSLGTFVTSNPIETD